MPEPISALTQELLLWIARRPRTYPEAMEAWRSNCPRQTVWEDALIAGLVHVARAPGAPDGAPVTLTSQGRAALDDAGALAHHTAPGTRAE